MARKVDLEEIIDGIECYNDSFDLHSFLNQDTGEVVFASSEDLHAAEEDEPYDHLPNWQQEERKIAVDIVENFPDLPKQFEVNEYDMMWDFIDTLDNEKHQKILSHGLNGRGAFRHFKDTIIDLDLSDEWYAFRDQAYITFAKNWCNENDISFYE